MQPNDAQNPPASLQLGDIYYILFRQKWVILLCSVLGFVAAGVIYKIRPALFESRARLLVPYVLETRSLAPVTQGAGEVQKTDSQGEGILESEIQILTSSDLALEVAGLVGPEKILGPMADKVTEPRSAAAGEILMKLKTDAPKRGNVIFVNFQHANPEVARQVLSELINAYRRKHVEIHRTLGEMDDFLDRKTGELRTSVSALDDELKALKSKAQIVSIEDTKKANLDQVSRIQSELYAAEALMAEAMAALPMKTNEAQAQATNAAMAAAVVAPPPVPEAKTAEYRRLVGQIEYFISRERDLLGQFTPENLQVKEIQGKIKELQGQKATMEKEEPGLLKEAQAVAGTGAPADGGGRSDLRTEIVRLAGLQAKIDVLRRQLTKVRSEAAAVEEVENKIRDLTRRKDVLEEQYKFYSKRLEEARLDQALGASKLSNIKVIQAPTAAGKDLMKVYKRVGAAAAGGIAAGLALAFLIEMFLDQSVRRPGDLGKKLRLPVFINVPRLRRLRSVAALASSQRKALKGPASTGDEGSSLLPALQSITETSSVVQPYCDALRDRLIHYFQKNNMTHKPKLVAVTGCGHGAGVSTVAAGLAASLSETGDGNVLLVDTNVTEGAALPFYRGQLACALNDALKEEGRSGAQVQDNLYVATASESDGALIKALPKRFSQLVPKLKASDYDYIIFDLPPVSQTSITSKLAGFMDMVLLVVESEKTNRGIVAEAADLLRDSRANVATVLNKSRRYVPQWVHREFE